MPHLPAFRSLLVVSVLGLPLAAAAQGGQQTEPWSLVPATARTSVGLNPERVSVTVGCGSSLLPCRDERASLAAREPTAFRWGLEVGPVAGAASNRLASTNARQGLNLSLVGRKPLFGSSFSVYGKLGTSTAYQDGGNAMAMTSGGEGYGLSFGGGLSWDFSPRVSATFGWESQELRLTGGTRDAVRATTLGLQYRY